MNVNCSFGHQTSSVLQALHKVICPHGHETIGFVRSYFRFYFDHLGNIVFNVDLENSKSMKVTRTKITSINSDFHEQKHGPIDFSWVLNVGASTRDAANLTHDAAPQLL